MKPTDELDLVLSSGSSREIDLCREEEAQALGGGCPEEEVMLPESSGGMSRWNE